MAGGPPSASFPLSSDPAAQPIASFPLSSDPAAQPSAEALSSQSPVGEPSSSPDASSGAEVAAVAPGAFTALQTLVSSESRLIEELQKRSPGATNIGREAAQGDSRGPYRHNGTPMVITTEAFASQGRYLVFWSGPENTQWKFPLRAAQEQTRSGTIEHYWRDSSRATFFDEPTVTFKFQAGNIMPIRIRNREEDTEAVFLPAGLLDYYDFFDMLNQEKILPDGRPNFVFISYHSLVYPEIFLRGFFTPDGLSFSDSSSDPASLTWSSTFKIRSTEPPFWSSAQLISTWNESINRTSSLFNSSTGPTDQSRSQVAGQ